MSRRSAFFCFTFSAFEGIEEYCREELTQQYLLVSHLKDPNHTFFGDHYHVIVYNMRTNPLLDSLGRPVQEGYKSRFFCHLGARRIKSFTMTENIIYVIRHLVQPPREVIHADREFQCLIDFVRANPKSGQGQTRRWDRTDRDIETLGCVVSVVFVDEKDRLLASSRLSYEKFFIDILKGHYEELYNEFYDFYFGQYRLDPGTLPLHEKQARELYKLLLYLECTVVTTGEHEGPSSAQITLTYKNNNNSFWVDWESEFDG